MSKKTPKTSITVSRETLALANRIKGWRQYIEGKKYNLDETLNLILSEEDQRIKQQLKRQEGQ